MHILLVEDNLHDIFFVQRALKILEQPVELNVVGDGEEALNFLFHRQPYTEAAQPDLILLDLTLPRKTGMEVLAELDHDRHLKAIPVIILTSSANPRELARCYELGARACFVKSMHLGEFFTLMKATVDFWGRCRLPPLTTAN
jgi:CheY-like chemotaxis protein